MNREELLVNCIDEIRAGRRTLEQCAASHPEIAHELRELLSIASQVAAESVSPSAEFKRRARNRLMQEMDAAEARRRNQGGWLRFVPLRKLNYAFTVASIMLAAGSGTAVYASQNSLPSDVLYPLKTGTENLHLALTLNPEARTKLHLNLADRRIQEVIAESVSDREISDATLDALAAQIDGAISGMSKVQPEEAKGLLARLSQSTLDHQASLGEVAKAAPEREQAALKKAIDLTRRGNLIAQVASDNPSFLGTGASSRDDRLESGYFELEGGLVSVEGNAWNIGGVVLANVNYAREVPAIGSSVHVKGIVRNNGTFLSRVETTEDVEPHIKIKGIFGGTDASGKGWNIGGVPVGQFSAAPPPTGNQVELRGTLQDGVFTVEGLERKRVESGESRVSGILKKVDPDHETIGVELAGANVTINVSAANIKDSDGKPLDLKDMESIVGKDVRAGSIYKNNNKVYAGDVQVDSNRHSRDEKSDNKQDQKDKEGGKPNDSKGDQDKSGPGDSRDKPSDIRTKPDENRSGNDGNRPASGDSRDKPSDIRTKPDEDRSRSDDNQPSQGGSRRDSGDSGGSRSSDDGGSRSGDGGGSRSGDDRH